MDGKNQSVHNSQNKDEGNYGMAVGGVEYSTEVVWPLGDQTMDR